MSLTRILKDKLIREKFVEQFKKPTASLSGSLLAPPYTKNYMLVGMAFDYLLRFYLEHLNPTAIKHLWMAERAMARFGVPDLEPSDEHDLMHDLMVEHMLELNDYEVETYNSAKHMLLVAKEAHDLYIKTGEITDDIISAGLLLAQLDAFTRSGYYDEMFGQATPDDIRDLRGLVSILNPEMFKAHDLCILNPTFGKASLLVGEADADYFLDHTLVEIKTTKELKFTREFFLQLMGYYVLYRMGGIDLAPKPIQVERLGVYFSRFGVLYTFPVTDVVDETTFPAFLDWFSKTVPSRHRIRPTIEETTDDD